MSPETRRRVSPDEGVRPGVYRVQYGEVQGSYGKIQKGLTNISDTCIEEIYEKYLRKKKTRGCKKTGCNI